MENRIERIAKKVVAADASDVLSMETSTREIDKACKLMNEAIMVLRKWEAALQVRKLKNKVNDATNIDIDGLIDAMDKVVDKTTTYSIRLSVLKEKLD